jgi:RHS repeat-associated protein
VPLAVDDADLTYTSDNRLADYKGQAVEYDADGNMTFGPLDGSMEAFAYDSLNRLTGVNGTGYVYDAGDSRVSVTDSVYQTTVNYVVNPHAPLSQVLIKTDSRGQIFYVYGLGLIGQQEPDGTYKSYHYDYRGSTVAMTDANGGITDRFQYGPYGEATRRMGGTDTPFLYCGEHGIMTDRNGLNYMRARYYSPEVGRFISRDSYEGDITEPKSLDLYAYVEGNPLIYIDPTGHMAWDEAWDSFWNGVDIATSADTYEAGCEVAAENLPKGLSIFAKEGLLGIDEDTYNRYVSGQMSKEEFNETTAIIFFNLATIYTREAKAAKGAGKAWSKVEANALRSIGIPAESSGIRAVTGNADDAYNFFKAQVNPATINQVKPGVLIGQDANGITFTYRAFSKSGPPTIDVNGVDGIRKIKFLP